MNQKINFSYTFLEVLATLVTIFGLGQFFDVFTAWQAGIMNNWTSIFVMCGSMILISVFVAILWHRKDSDRSNSAHQWIETFVSFYLVYMICSYAFAKILKTQFQPPNFILETPIGELSGFWLTWTYYGFSETFAYILGWTQIAGCILLLFKKTRLIGTFILIPVMVNICLIDHFYEISPLAYFNALHYTFLLFFILSLDIPKLIPVFFAAENKLKFGNWKFWALNTIRVLVVALAFNKIYGLRESFQPKTKINGVWSIEKASRAGRDLTPGHLPDSLWSKIYFEWRYGCVFKFHPDQKLNDQFGRYTVNEKESEIKINVTGQPKGDSLLLRYNFVSDSTLRLTGLYNKDSVGMELRKLK